MRFIVIMNQHSPHPASVLTITKDSELLCGSDGEGLASSLGSLAEHLGRLVATDTSTPLTTLLVVLVRARDKEC